ncbi:hypothetical protein BYT27DRAFT_7334045 [Phlegmacium glaucopus]|nr:hypothetical protein BYT27DRAFT_7334045 [Phlegmacium glaucopus]
MIKRYLKTIWGLGKESDYPPTFLSLIIMKYPVITALTASLVFLSYALAVPSQPQVENLACSGPDEMECPTGLFCCIEVAGIRGMCLSAPPPDRSCL